MGCKQARFKRNGDNPVETEIPATTPRVFPRWRQTGYHSSIWRYDQWLNNTALLSLILKRCRETCA